MTNIVVYHKNQLLFLIYVNDLNVFSSLLNPITFADDILTEALKSLFNTMKEELKFFFHITSEWFKAKKIIHKYQ